MTEPKDILDAVVDSFWRENDSLQDMILRDVYAHGFVTEATNEAARAAVDKWLTAPYPHPNGDRQ